jgi:hypothetical protein
VLRREKLPLPPIIDGNWDAFIRVGLSCCPEGQRSEDIILLSTIAQQPFMLKSLASVVLRDIRPKGARPLSGSTVYVVRVNNQGERRLARPCDRCMRQLKEHGVKWVVFSKDEGWSKERL